jgi:hypothetical protein
LITAKLSYTPQNLVDITHLHRIILGFIRDRIVLTPLAPRPKPSEALQRLIFDTTLESERSHLLKKFGWQAAESLVPKRNLSLCWDESLLHH